MTFKSFLAGSLVALIIGFLTAQFYDILGVIIGIILGSLVAGSKKSGGFIGFFFAPFILYSGLVIYASVQLITGSMDILEAGLLLLSALFNIFTTIIAIIGLVIGVITAYLYLKYTSNVKKETDIKDLTLEDLDKLEVEI